MGTRVRGGDGKEGMGGGCKEVGVRMGSVEEEEGWWLVFWKEKMGVGCSWGCRGWIMYGWI